MVFSNAWKSIYRSKGRNILISIIVLTIAISASIALAIQNAADTAKETGISAQTVTGTIAVNREKLMENMQSGGDRSSMQEAMQEYSGLTLEEMETYADSDYVQDFYYTSSLSINGSDSFDPYSTSDSSSSSSSTMQGGMGGMGGGGQFQSGDFQITAVASESALTQFISGESKIVEGEMMDVTSDEQTVIISQELAAFNELEVGDTITLTNPNNEDETYEFEIVGLYSTSSSSESTGGMQFSTAQDPANMIYMSQGAMENMVAASAENPVTSTDDMGNEVTSEMTAQVSGTYVFENTEAYDSFEQEISDKGLSDYYQLSSSDIESYNASLVPLENLSSYAATFLYLVLLVGAVILVVLNFFNIRERKYEVGVLTAIGIKKWKVATQFVTELLIITLTAVIIGAGIGSVAAVPVADSLLASQIDAQTSQQTSQEANFGRSMGGGTDQAPTSLTTQAASFLPGGSQTTEYISSINASINLEILIKLIGIGLLLTLVSSFVAVVFVLRYEPLKILANRT